MRNKRLVNPLSIVNLSGLLFLICSKTILGGPSLEIAEAMYKKATEKKASNKTSVRFGASIVSKEGKLVGIGRNRRRTEEDKKFWAEKLAYFGSSISDKNRRLRMPDYASHAELSAIKDAVEGNNVPFGEVHNYTMYVMGVNKDGEIERLPFARFVCRSGCGIWLEKIRLDVNVLTVEGWEAIPHQKIQSISEEHYKVGHWGQSYQRNAQSQFVSFERYKALFCSGSFSQ